ncbi:hypothetical protein PLICRDRAFT_582957 [Plicaturopsis crispa FD-325 SS-3]|nr:hypothetical protein PLICRDRAFT_582957 [Plicaturopsis crispa FD-325 SS-3]
MHEDEKTPVCVTIPYRSAPNLLLLMFESRAVRAVIMGATGVYICSSVRVCAGKLSIALQLPANMMKVHDTGRSSAGSQVGDASGCRASEFLSGKTNCVPSPVCILLPTRCTVAVLWLGKSRRELPHNAQGALRAETTNLVRLNLGFERLRTHPWLRHKYRQSHKTSVIRRVAFDPQSLSDRELPMTLEYMSPRVDWICEETHQATLQMRYIWHRRNLKMRVVRLS